MNSTDILVRSSSPTSYQNHHRLHFYVKLCPTAYPNWHHQVSPRNRKMNFLNWIRSSSTWLVISLLAILALSNCITELWIMDGKSHLRNTRTLIPPKQTEHWNSSQRIVHTNVTFIMNETATSETSLEGTVQTTKTRPPKVVSPQTDNNYNQLSLIYELNGRRANESLLAIKSRRHEKIATIKELNARLATGSRNGSTIASTRPSDSQQSQSKSVHSKEFHKQVPTEMKIPVKTSLMSLRSAWKKNIVNRTNVPTELQVFTIGSMHSFLDNIVRKKHFVSTYSIHSMVSIYWNLTLCDQFLPKEFFTFHRNGSKLSHIEKLSFHDSSIYNAVLQNTLFNLSFSCNDVFVNSGYGTGNYILTFVALEFAAQLIGNIDINLHCTDAEEMQSNLILPWFMGVYPRTIWPPSIQAQQRTYPTTIYNSCYSYTSIEYSIPTIVFRLRRMAVALLGVMYARNEIYLWAEKNLWSARNDLRNQQLQLPNPTRLSKPLVSNITELDDTIIHFRCGDIMDSNDTRFGFMKFTSIAKYIPLNTTSIGIVTQPFSVTEGQQRSLDKKNSDTTMKRCKVVVSEFVTYLRTIFPDSNTVRISIRNDREETIAITFARIIYAKVAIVGVSSFGTIAALASFGSSYVLNAPVGINKWLNSILTNKASKTNISTEETSYRERVHLIQEPLLVARICQEYWTKDNGETVLKWFRNESMVLSPLPYKTERNLGAAMTDRISTPWNRIRTLFD